MSDSWLSWLSRPNFPLPRSAFAVGTQIHLGEGWDGEGHVGVKRWVKVRLEENLSSMFLAKKLIFTEIAVLLFL